MNRFIIVDDSDTEINYSSGTWSSPPTAALDELYMYSGASMFSTLHSLDSATGSLSYNFEGIGVRAFVTTFRAHNNSNAVYSVHCFVDGETVAISAAPPTEDQNNFLLCASESLSEGDHTLLMTFGSGPVTVFFDYLLVRPSKFQSLDGKDLMILPTDSLIQSSFSEADLGWTNVGGNYQTSIPNSQLTIEFFGVSLVWYGYYTLGMQWQSSVGMYTVDGQSFPFDTAPKVQPTTSLQLQPLFQTFASVSAHHTLKVVYQGSNLTSPLTIQSLMIKGLSFSGPSAASITPIMGSQKELAGGLAGGLSGGTALLLMGTAFLLHRRRRRRHWNATLAPVPFEPVLHSGFVLHSDLSTVGPCKAPSQERYGPDGPQARWHSLRLQEDRGSNNDDRDAEVLEVDSAAQENESGAQSTHQSTRHTPTSLPPVYASIE